VTTSKVASTVHDPARWSVRFARVDDGLELGVGQQLVDVGRERPIARLGGATEAIAADCTSLVGCA
jgi:hypothetical protein